MKFEELRENFIEANPQRQIQIFSEYYHKRNQDLIQENPLLISKTKNSSTKPKTLSRSKSKKKEKKIVLSQKALNALNKLGLI